VTPGRVGWATAGLVAVTFVWGASFVVVQEGVARLPVWAFNAWRFTIAAAALGLIAGPRLRQLGGRGVRDGVLLGTALWAGYALQTFGLTRTTASKAAFVTGMFVVITPFLQAVVVRRAPSGAAWGSALVALAGLALLTLQGSLLPATGDLLMLGCALAFALHIVGLGAWSRGRSAAALATVQLATSAVLHAAGGVVEAALTPGVYDWWPGDLYVWGALGFTAVFASAFAFTMQTWAQSILEPTRTAVILTMEPVFAALTEVVGVPLLTWLGITGLVATVLGPREALGAGLILGAMLWSELRTGEPPDALAAPETGALVDRTATAQPASDGSASGENRSRSDPTVAQPRITSSETARSW